MIDAERDRLRAAFAPMLAREAGALAKRFFEKRDRLEVERKKSAHDLVSVADRAVEAMIRERLAAFFPEDGIIGEEEAARPPAREGGGHWVVDPIDGTWCFVNGIRSFCVSIAYARGGEVLTGAIYDPCSDEMFAARKGGGAFANDAPMRVSEARSLGDGATSIGYAAEHKRPEDAKAALARALDAGGVYHRHGSGALGLAWTAAGRLIAYVEPLMNSWDCLAGLLLVREAGGWTNDFLREGGLEAPRKVLAGPKGLEPALRAIGEDFDLNQAD